MSRGSGMDFPPAWCDRTAGFLTVRAPLPSFEMHLSLRDFDLTEVHALGDRMLPACGVCLTTDVWPGSAVSSARDLVGIGGRK